MGSSALCSVLKPAGDVSPAGDLYNFVKDFLEPFSKFSMCIENYSGFEYSPFYNKLLKCYQTYVIEKDKEFAENELKKAKNEFNKMLGIKNDVDDPVGFIKKFRGNEK